jgi:hypothetical protein
MKDSDPIGQTEEIKIALDGQMDLDRRPSGIQIVAEVDDIRIQIGGTQGPSSRARRCGGGFGLVRPRPWRAGGGGVGAELRFRQPVKEVREEVRWRKGERLARGKRTPRPAKCTGTL